MNVQKYLTDLLSERLPVRLPAFFAHMSVRQSKASWQVSTIPSILSNISYLLLCFCFSHCLDAEIHFVNMTALTRGRLRSSFWIVDRKHIYIGSADMDWRSLSKVTTGLNNMHAQRKIRPRNK